MNRQTLSKFLNAVALRRNNNFRLPGRANKKIFTKKSLIIASSLLVGVLLLGVFGLNRYVHHSKADPANPADTNFIADPTTIPACNNDPECFAFEIDTRLTSSGTTTSPERSFNIPTSGRLNNNNYAYYWYIDWGDGSAVQYASGTSGQSFPVANGITHQYNSPGLYQITIRPDRSKYSTSVEGWFNAFGFHTSSVGANSANNKSKFLAIKTPFTNLMRTANTTRRFAYIFQGAVNAIGIPTELFANVSTVGDTNFSQMFYYTFNNYAKQSSAIIPGDLFKTINTSTGLDFTAMFGGTFFDYATKSAAGIPAGLFSTINTSQGTSFSEMFQLTFRSYSSNASVGIPAGLFSGIYTNNGDNFYAMFDSTFSLHARNSSAGIPAGLFSGVSTSNSDTSFQDMFHSTFSGYAVVSTAGIPANLFSGIDTSNCSSTLQDMFNSTFSDYATMSTAGIPAGLFSGINTENGRLLSGMFSRTFYKHANSSLAGIPAGLFSVVNTSNALSLSDMFSYTFSDYAANSTAGIPSNLFSAINTPSGTDFTGMFEGTFSCYAMESNSAIPANLFSALDTTRGTNFTAMFYMTFDSYALYATSGIPAGLFSAIKTGAGRNFRSMFSNTFISHASKSTVGTIPAGLFSGIDTSQGTDFDSMFTYTFSRYATASTVGTIPAGLFSGIDTSLSTQNFNYMFYETFSNYATASTVGTIPAGLFSGINTSLSSNNFYSMFEKTFANYATASTVGTIPDGLFDGVDVHLVLSLSYLVGMFEKTFSNYATASTVGTIPTGLFEQFRPTSATSINFDVLFYRTFDNYAQRTATFKVNDATVGTPQVFTDPYTVKNGINGDPDAGLSTNPNDIVYPSYNSTVRTITVPVGYSHYDWYYKDGTPCSGVANPTPDCGPQDATSLAAFPGGVNSTEWTPSTSTEKGGVTFYGVFTLVLDLSLSSSSVAIGGPGGITPSGPDNFASANNTVTVTTNNPTGYKLSLSTDQPNTNPNASDMAHQSIANTYLPATANTCSWNNGLINTTTALAANTWGFTLSGASLSGQKLCKVPNLNNLLTIKSTTTGDMSGNNTIVHYGAKIDLSQPAGQYQTTIVYTALAN